MQKGLCHDDVPAVCREPLNGLVKVHTTQLKEENHLKQRAPTRLEVAIQ